MSNSQDPRNIFVAQRQEYSEPKQENTTKKTESEYKTVPPQNKDDYADKVEEYEREGEGQLVKDIVNNVIEQKARGNLTNDQLIMFAKRVTPLLNSEQRERLNGLLNELLKI